MKTPKKKTTRRGFVFSQPKFAKKVVEIVAEITPRIQLGMKEAFFSQKKTKKFRWAPYQLFFSRLQVGLFHPTHWFQAMGVDNLHLLICHGPCGRTLIIENYSTCFSFVTTHLKTSRKMGGQMFYPFFWGVNPKNVLKPTPRDSIIPLWPEQPKGSGIFTAKEPIERWKSLSQGCCWTGWI